MFSYLFRHEDSSSKPVMGCGETISRSNHALLFNPGYRDAEKITGVNNEDIIDETANSLDSAEIQSTVVAECGIAWRLSHVVNRRTGKA